MKIPSAYYSKFNTEAHAFRNAWFIGRDQLKLHCSDLKDRRRSLEYWSVGVLEKLPRDQFLKFPLLHYSSTPKPYFWLKILSPEGNHSSASGTER